MRDAVAADLATLTPCDALEAADLNRARRWVASYAPLARVAKPACPPQHLVAYFPVIDRAARAVLLGDHRTSGLWLPPGGHVEPGETPRATVRREALEELGAPPDPADPAPVFVTISPTVGPGRHVDVSLWYPLTGRAPALPHFDPGEYRAMAWFGYNNLPAPDRTDPNLRRFVAKLDRA